MEAFFQTNYAIVASVSGQAFFIIGLLAAWEFRRYSQLPLARPLWMLAIFGLFYALAEWGRVFIPIQETYMPYPVVETLRLIRVLLLTASFGALLQFGIELLPPRSRKRLRALPPILAAAWVGIALGGGGTAWNLQFSLALSEAQARLLLAMPAGMICALGLFIQERYLLRLGGPPLARWVRTAAVAAIMTGLALGLMVPPIGPWGGTEWLLGAPAEVWRGLTGLLFAVAMARTLAVFQLEQDRLLEEAEHQAIAAQARERLGRELSDRLVQHLYAVGLLLSEAASRAPADDPIHHALGELDVSIGELRRFMQDGEAEARAGLNGVARVGVPVGSRR